MKMLIFEGQAILVHILVQGTGYRVLEAVSTNAAAQNVQQHLKDICLLKMRKFSNFKESCRP